jgi:hypothetical protein
MKKQSTKQLMQELRDAIKQLKTVHEDRSNIIDKFQGQNNTKTYNTQPYTK